VLVLIKYMRYLTGSILIICVFLTGCASVSMLPESASEVDFSADEGKVGWSKYAHTENFRGYTPEQIYDSAKAGLGAAGFSLRQASLAGGYAKGEHGMTAHDWNIIAGVYFRENVDGTKVKVIIEGSKDIGFSGDVTSDGWSGKILVAMRNYLNATNTSILRVEKEDLK
jgi:hypothetical protein